MSEPLTPAYDPETLRESYPDTTAVHARIAQLRDEIHAATLDADATAELLARGELVRLLRGSGEFDAALSEALAAADRADIAGSPAQQHLARVRLAQVHSQRGDYVDSNILFTELDASKAHFGAVIDAYTHQRSGENDYAQGHWTAAKSHFASALALRAEFTLDEEAESRIALAATRRREGS